MNWLTDFVRPRIRAMVGKDIPENLWIKCPKCEHMLFTKVLLENLNICPHCGAHLRLSCKDRLNIIFDKDTFVRLPKTNVLTDPLKFKDTKKYTDRLKEYREKTGENDALITGYGDIDGKPVVVAAFNFDFMGGSMGMSVGNHFVEACKYAVQNKMPFLVIPCSGGARMQEGLFSLMQMPRTVAGTNMLKSARLPFISLLTDPTTGGVSASFALLGDINIAEPGALIAFTGPRVIAGTIREKLPDGFQTAEYLLEHGMIDLVVNRKELKNTLSKIIRNLYYKGNAKI